MPIDLTHKLARATDIERRKFKPKDSIAELMKGENVLATLDDKAGGWDWETVDQRAAGGKRFTKLTVYDTRKIEKLSQSLRSLDGVRINGRKFKKTDLFEPEEATREWVIELQPTGN